ncbi:MAG: NYN domain-containing protein, partial [Acetatifactor sp.]|nr:NYN domain-containing protein [Acetatifactor sp.]
MDVEDRKLALLIDADNISPIYVNIMLNEAKNYGTVSVRRIYGDWTSSGKNSWKSVMLDASLTPIQQYSYTYGKNASDSAMIIDAMDILYADHVDGFILASSDSDFTRLAMRLREAGKFVIGMGESKTPAPFVKSCDEFKVLDILLKNSISDEEEKRLAKTGGATSATEQESVPTPITKLSVIKKSMLDIIDKNSDENGQIQMSKLASMLTRLYSDFDARNYGKYSKFSNFV